MKHPCSHSTIVACVCLIGLLASAGFSQSTIVKTPIEDLPVPPGPEKMYRGACQTLLGAFRDIISTKKEILSTEQLQSVQAGIARLEEIARAEIIFPTVIKGPSDVPVPMRDLPKLLGEYRTINSALPVTTIDVVNAARFWNLDHLERMSPDRITLPDLEKLVNGGYLAKRPDFWDEARQTIEKEGK